MARGDAFVIDIPETLADSDLERFFRGWRWLVPTNKRVALDFQHCEFLAPWALTLLAAYGLWLGEEHGKDVEIRIDPATDVGDFVLNSGFFDLFSEEEKHSADRAGFTVCMRQIHNESEISNFIGSVCEMLHIGDE